MTLAADIAIRPLSAADLDAVVTIDAAVEGRTRREYLSRRLDAARREPGLHAQFAAGDAQGLAGYVLARVLAGEFGRSRPALRLEIVGVRPDLRGTGVGRRLFDALATWASRHGIGEVRTSASWRDSGMLGWFDALGFRLAPELILECTVDRGAALPERDPTIAPEPGEGPGHEIDYGRTEANDHERLARGAADVRAMTEADLDAIVAIDRSITGRDRREYIAGRFAEAMQANGVRVSLAARCDDTVVGYLMARADHGDYGRTAPVAVIDTLGVDPRYARRHVGRALLAQLFAHLGALRVERVETVVAQRDLALLGFLYGCGFVPSQRLAFERRLGAVA